MVSEWDQQLIHAPKEFGCGANLFKVSLQMVIQSMLSSWILKV